MFLVLVSSCKKEEQPLPTPIATISMERIGTSSQSFIVPGQQNFVIYEFRVTALIDISLSEIQLAIKAGSSLVHNSDFIIVINDVAQDQESYDGRDIEFRFDNLILKSSQNLVIKVYANIHDSVTRGESITVSLNSLQAIDLSGNIIDSYTKPLGGAVFRIK